MTKQQVGLAPYLSEPLYLEAMSAFLVKTKQALITADLNGKFRRKRSKIEQEMPFVPGGIVHFPKETCAQCPLQTQCTTSARGRSVSIRPDEALLMELRQHQQTPQGRAQLRERVAVEHTLAHVGRWQGRRARYRGVRKNLFDLRRCAVIHNLHLLARSQQLSADLQAA